MAKTVVKWTKEMSFDVELNGHHFAIDAGKDNGGNDAGPRPKALMLSALGGCTGMDVVSILKKMKVVDYELSITVTADQTDQHPKILQNIMVHYDFSGQNLPVKKLQRAVELSETAYCGVSAMLKKASELNHQIRLNGEIV
jgi:putative redox protein